MPARSSERTSVNLLASSASLAAYASARPWSPGRRRCPATTKLPDSTSVADLLVDGIGLAGEQRLVDLEALGLDDLAVDDDLVARTEFDDVVEDDLVGRQRRHRSVAADHRLGLADDGQLVERALGAHLLDDPDPLLATMSRPNIASMIEPVASTIASSMPRITLIRVNTLARTISPTDRDARSGTSLVAPGHRSATSA